MNLCISEVMDVDQSSTKKKIYKYLLEHKNTLNKWIGHSIQEVT